MRIQQLIEGQKEQIAGLRRSSVVTLYHPTDVEGAASIVTRHDVSKQFEVMPALKYAVRHGDVVIQFSGQGKNLEAPRRSRKDQQLAARVYPDSYDPLVSFSMLSQRPGVIYTGLISPGNIGKIYVMMDGKAEAMDPEEYLKYVIKVRSDAQRQNLG